MAAATDRPIIVMGAQGTGKTTIGVALASRLGRPFVDTDDLHPPSNVAKMRAGIPLEDEDRVPWLKRIGKEIRDRAAAGQHPVLACSALKRWYRELLRSEAPDVLFIHLTGDEQLIQRRIEARDHAFMPTSLLESQLDTLEPPAPWEGAIEVDIAPSPEEIIRRLIPRLPRDTAPAP